MGMARRFRESTRANYVLLVAGIVLFLSSSIYLTVFPLGSSQGSRFGNVIYEATSVFVEDQVFDDDAAPGTSQLRYAKGLFSSFLFRHPQKRILIVGLGAGGMVRYLNHNFPEMMVEAVEIDPVVVAVAAEYFQTVPGPKTVLHTADAFAFFNDDHGLYDVIYMDAFLRPPADVTLEEKAKRLKTEAFLHELKSHLLPGGVIAFNLIEWEEGTPDDLAAIRTVFPETYLFGVPQSGNLAVIATTRDPAPSREELAETAVLLNRNAPADLDFSELVENLRE